MLAESQLLWYNLFNGRNDHTTIAIYARQSILKEDSLSIEIQTETCQTKNNQAYSNAKVVVFEDRGFSGKNTNRPQFQALVEEIEQNKIDIKFKAEEAVIEEEESIQYNFAANGKNEIIEILKTIDVNTLTPIEAMQTLYDLKKKSEEL